MLISAISMVDIKIPKTTKLNKLWTNRCISLIKVSKATIRARIYLKTSTCKTSAKSILMMEWIWVISISTKATWTSPRLTLLTRILAISHSMTTIVRNWIILSTLARWTGHKSWMKSLTTHQWWCLRAPYQTWKVMEILNKILTTTHTKADR